MLNCDFNLNYTVGEGRNLHAKFKGGNEKKGRKKNTKKQKTQKNVSRAWSIKRLSLW